MKIIKVIKQLLNPKKMDQNTSTTTINELVNLARPTAKTYQGKGSSSVDKFKKLREKLKENGDRKVSNDIVNDFKARLNDESSTDFNRKYQALKILKGAGF